MVVEVIYVVRHGFRSNWVVNHTTGAYTATVKSPTGIASDPALASYGVGQAEQLAEHVDTLDPRPTVVYSSPFYRCLQTVKPSAENLGCGVDKKTGRDGGIRVENGLGEFYGLARFDHPSPATLSALHTHFPSLLDPSYTPVIIPSTNGESITTLHDRVAYTLYRIIEDLDKQPDDPKAVLVCTHAATMIAIGRVLTGRMPGDVDEEDFKCYTASLSRFERRRKHGGELLVDGVENVGYWDSSRGDEISQINWRDGKGVKGGWDCMVNGDCSFLSGGEERGWRFSGDEAFLADPNAFNDAANADQPTHAEAEDAGPEKVAEARSKISEKNRKAEEDMSSPKL